MDKKMYLVQMLMQNSDDLGVAIISENEVIKLTNEMDFNGLEYLVVYEIHNKLGEVKKLHYLGWQPNCLIQYADDNENIIISGYGTDH